MEQAGVENAGTIIVLIVLSVLVIPSVAYLKWGYRYIRRRRVLPESELNLETGTLDSAVVVLSALSVVAVMVKLENVFCALGLWILGPIGVTSLTILRSLAAQRIYERMQSESSVTKSTSEKTP